MPRLLLLCALLASCRFTLDRTLEAGTLRARLVVAGDHSAEPLVGARLVLESTRLSATSDTNGLVVLRGVPAGRWTVRATAAGGLALRLAGVELGTDGGEVDGLDLGTLTLGAVGAIEGTVTKAGVPMAGAIVAGTGAGQAKTDTNGRFRLAQLPAGPYALAVAPANGGLFVQVDAKVERAKTTTVAIELDTLQPGAAGRVTGRAVEIGVPVAPIAIALVGAERTELETDDHSRFDSVTDLAAGVYRLTARAKDGASIRVEPVIVNGATDVGELVLVPGSAEDGVLQITGGSPQEGIAGTPLTEPLAVQLLSDVFPVVGATITFTGGIAESGARVLTDAEGTAKLSATLGGTLGDVTVVASAEGTAGVTFQLAAKAGPARELVLSGLPSPLVAGVPATLRLAVHDAFGNVAAGFTGEVALASTDEAATFPDTVSFVPTDAGVKEVAITFATAGTQSITAESGSLRGALDGLQVVAGDPAKIVVQNEGVTMTAGNGASLNVRVTDAQGNAVSAWSGTLHTTTDGAEASPDMPLSQPSGFVFLSLTRAGARVVTVADLAGVLAPAVTTVEVTPGIVKKLLLSDVPPIGTVGAAFPATVTLHDTYDNVTPSEGTGVRVVLDDFAAALPPAHVLVASDAGRFHTTLTPATARTTTVRAQTTDGKLASNVMTIAVSGTASQLTAQALTTVSGCANIPYTLTAATARRLDVRAEFTTGSTWTPISFAPASADTEGPLARLANESGAPHVLRWDSTRDLPHQTTTARLRLTPIDRRVAGTPVELTIATVGNGPAFPSSTTFGSSASALELVRLGPERQLDLVKIGSPGISTLSPALSPSSTITSGVPSLAGLAMADFNHDGGLDTAAGSASSVVVMRNASVTLAQTLTTSAPVSRLAAGDFDHDGWADLAIQAGNGTFVAWNDGAGTLRAPVAFASSWVPTGMVAGDVSGDGIDDLVMVDGTSASVRVGRGAQGVQSLTNVTYTTPSIASDVAVADFDGDGAPDLLLAAANGEWVVTNPSGSASNTQISTRPERRITAGDLDGDGLADVAAWGQSGAITLVTHPRGVLRETTIGRQVDSTWVARIGDVDGDGDGDVVASGATVAIQVHLNEQPAPCTAGLRAGETAGWLPNAVATVIGDFDDDGWRDAAAQDTAGTISVVTGNGDGTFGATIATIPGTAYRSLTTVVDDTGRTRLARVDPDGAIHLIAPGISGSDLGLPSAGAGSHVTLVDLDRDGVRDVVYLTTTGGGRWMRGRGANQYDAPIAWGGTATITAFAPVENATTGFYDFWAAAGGLGVFAGDSSLAYGNFNVRMFAGTPTAFTTFRPSATEPIAIAIVSAGSPPSAAVVSPVPPTMNYLFRQDEAWDRLVAGDFDGDGDEEVLIADPTGNGRILTETPLETAAFAPGTARATGDLDGDGRDELLVVESSGRRHVYAAGPEGLTALRRPLVGSIASLLGAARLRPGRADTLAVTIQYTNGAAANLLTIPRNARQASLSPITAALSSTMAAFAPTGGDWTPDLVGLGTTGPISLVPTDAAGALATSATTSTVTLGSLRAPLLIADFNNDAAPDLALLSSGGSKSAQLFLGTRTRTFTAGNGWTFAAPTSATTLDTDRDGLPDLVVSTAAGMHFVRSAARTNATANQFVSGAYAAVCAGDLDGDGRDDLVGLTSDGLLAQWSHFSGGTNGPTTTKVIDSGATQCATRDFDGDGRAELIYAAAGIVHVVSNGIDRGLGLPASTCFTLGDFDGDGATDLVGACNALQQAQLAWGR